MPGGASNACIDVAGTYTVTLDVNATVNSLTLGRTTGTARQTLLVASNNLTLSTNSTVNSRGIVDMAGGDHFHRRGCDAHQQRPPRHLRTGLKDIGGSTTIRNQASTTYAGTGTLRFLGGSSVFVNAVGATFDAQGDGDFTFFNGGNTFTNDGLFQKSAPAPRS